MKQSAIITATVAAGSATSPYYVDVDIRQQLCQKTCVVSVPVFAPQFSVVGFKSVGTSQYEVEINVQGAISYCPCHQCKANVVPINQNFIVPVFSAAAISEVTVTAGAPNNSMIRNGCRPCSSRFLSQIPISLVVTTA